MQSRHPLIANLLSIDFRNKIAVLRDEINALQSKVCFFAPEVCSKNYKAASPNPTPPGKDVFVYLHTALAQLDQRLAKYNIQGHQTPWGDETETTLAVGHYRMIMDDIWDVLQQLTVVESRFIQQMEARPLYFPSPRIFRRRHEEYQMFLNDRLSNQQLKLMSAALKALFPNTDGFDNLSYHILSSTEFIPDSQIVKDWISPSGYEVSVRQNDMRPVFYARLPYWFYSLPIMLPETAHEHVHICLMEYEGRPGKVVKALDEEFSELIGEIALLYQLDAGYFHSWPKDFARVMVEELIADIAATMVFGESYLLPLFLQLVGKEEGKAITQRQVPGQLPIMPWWSRLWVLLEILYVPPGKKLSSESLPGALVDFVKDHSLGLINNLPPDQIEYGTKVLEFHKRVMSVMLGWLRPHVRAACERLGNKPPLNSLVWNLEDKNQADGYAKEQRLEVKESQPGHGMTALHGKKAPQKIGQGWYSLWCRGFASEEQIPDLGQSLTALVNGSRPSDWKNHGRPFVLHINQTRSSVWNTKLHRAVPLEYMVWAGYMASVCGLEDQTKSIMNSFYQFIGRGMMQGFESAFKTLSGSNVPAFSPTRQTLKLEVVSNSVAVHQTRQLHFMKWRLESFQKVKEDLLSKLEQNKPWQWDQKDEYRFWVLGPFSALVATPPGYSRRSTHESTQDQVADVQYNNVLSPMQSLGLFGEELVISPLMIVEQKDSPTIDAERPWHVIIQIRIAAEALYMEQRQRCMQSKASAGPRQAQLFDPTQSLAEEIWRSGLWRPGDAVFTSTGWSHLVLILAPRTLNEAFEFKNALQGLSEVDRTQTSFGTLFRRGIEHDQLGDRFSFRTMLRLGDITGNGFNELQRRLADWSGEIQTVEEVPGIFDLQLTWKNVPTLDSMLDLLEIGNQVEIDTQASKGLHNQTGSLISDLQTSVTRRMPVEPKG